MTAKLDFSLFLMFAAFSMENTNKKTYSDRSKHGPARFRQLCRAITTAFQRSPSTLPRVKSRERSGYQESFPVQNQILQVPKLIAPKKRASEELKEISMPDRKLTEEKITGILNIFPNESSVKVFRDLETMELFWDDPKELIEIENKKSIEASLKQTGREMSNGIFYNIFDWNFPVEASPFVKMLLFSMSEHVSIDKKGHFNVTPLMICALLNAEKAVAKLIERGAKMEAVDKEKYTALHFAVYYGSEASCKVLLEKEANVDAQNKFGDTPLMLLMRHATDEDVKVVKLLLQFKANRDIKNEFGNTALELARGNYRDVIQENEQN